MISRACGNPDRCIADTKRISVYHKLSGYVEKTTICHCSRFDDSKAASSWAQSRKLLLWIWRKLGSI